MTNEMDISIAGFPETAITRERGGLTGYRISFRALGPKAAYFADRGGMLIALAFGGAGLGSVFYATAPNPVAMATAVLLPVCCAPLFRRTLRRLLARRSTIQFRPDMIEVTRRGRTIRVAHALEHRFAAHENDFSEIESELMQDRQRRRRKPGIFTPRYHHHAPHIALSVDGNRIEIATIFGRHNAQRVLARLTACDAWMTRQNQIGRPLQLTATDEQKPRPGGLPEDPPIKGSA